MNERPPPDDPEDDENPEFDRFEALTKKLLGVDGPKEVEDAAEQEAEIPADETDEG